MEELFLPKTVNVPTWGENILDLCFVNIMDLIVNTKVQQTNISDHNLVVIDTSPENKNIDTHSKNI